MSRVFIFILLLTSCNNNTKITLKGIEFGTTYSVQYFDNEQLDYTNQLDSFFIWAVVGVILGGRIGYVLFYQTNFIISIIILICSN